MAQLTDEADYDVRRKVAEMATQVPGVMSFDRVRARRMGPQTLVDLTIQTDDMITASAAQQVKRFYLYDSWERNMWCSERKAVGRCCFFRNAAVHSLSGMNCCHKSMSCIAAHIRCVFTLECLCPYHSRCYFIIMTMFTATSFVARSLQVLCEPCITQLPHLVHSFDAHAGRELNIYVTECQCLFS